MTLAGNSKPIMAWDGAATVSLSIVCHCGKSFTLDELDAAQAHIASHEIPGGEPS